MVKEKEKKELKISIGDQTQEGFEKVALPLPLSYRTKYADNSVTEIYCSNYLQRVPGKDRGKFIDELWRILLPGGKATVIVPYWSTMAAVYDFAYEWPPINEMSFLLFQKEWRVANNSHLELKCDFDFGYGYTLDPETATRAHDVQVFSVKHYLGTASLLQMTLTKK